ncbi:protocadherin-12 isoform X2 [Bombina bombina]|uniref:protocadherin-12 isoform X2 n=1 Tax=Bombina bombina TaxID=8345 RepID=UPI00235B0873|nr:protocadherin-12 isoform X2 [Bombina bombina]
MGEIAKIISHLYVFIHICFLYKGLCHKSASLMVRFRIQEEVPIGTLIGQISDAPGLTVDVNEKYQLMKEPTTFPLQVGLDDGSITTTGRLDREELCLSPGHCLLSFNVLATKALTLVYVEIEVLDINDNEPSFLKPDMDMEISESALLRTRFPLDRAFDLDSGNNAVKLYTLSPSEHFALDVTTGTDGIKYPELVIVKELDRELQSSFYLVLTAFDGGVPRKSGTTQIRINILDSNDNSPVFEESSVILEVSEDTSPGTLLLNLTATDPDQGPNGEIEFSFSKHTPHHVLSMFSIDPKLGEIFLKQPLDHENRHSYELDVQAKDLGPNPIPTHCKVLIKVLDINDNVPDIQVTWASEDSQVIEVPETVPWGSFVALVMAKDPDSGTNGQVQCHLIQEQTHFKLERANGNNYILLTNATLDREKMDEYNLIIQAQDSGVPSFSSNKPLKIRVSDANDNAPLFEKDSYEVFLDENNSPPTHLITVQALDTDLDANAEVTYSIIDSSILGTTASTFFSIHPSTGEIFAIQSLDYEETREIQLFVQAEDNGNPKLSSNTSVRVFLTDKNDNSPVIKQPPLRKGHASITVLVNAETGHPFSSIEMHNSQKHGHSTSEKRVLINMDIPMASTKFNTHPIFHVLATDADSNQNAELIYWLKDDHHGLFVIDEHIGQLYLNASNASYLIGNTLNLEVFVRDNGTPQLDTKAHLNVMFMNHLDHLKNSGEGSNGKLSNSIVIVICLAVLLAVCLLILALIMSYCRVDRKDNRAYNCREEESAYRNQPRRPQRQIQKTDIHVVPVLRGRQQNVPSESSKPLSYSDDHNEIPEDDSLKTPFHLTPTLYRTLRNQHNHDTIDEDAQDVQSPFSLPPSVCRTLQYQRQRSCSRENIQDLHNTLPSPSKTLKNIGSPQVNLSDNQSVSEPFIYNSGTLQATSPTLRRQRNNTGESSQEQILRSLVRLSMAALAERDGVELTMQSPHVQQISQLLSLLHQGQVHPKTLHRGNKYSSKNGRCAGQENDWQSTKDSGNGGSEAGDLDSEPGVDLPASQQQLLEESLETLLAPCMIYFTCAELHLV